MSDSKVFMLPDAVRNSSSLDPNLLFALNQNGGFGGNNWMWILFLWLIWGGYGYGNGFGGGFGNNGAAGFLSNQMNNDAGRELLMNAIQGNTTSIQQLANLLGTEVQTVQNGIFTLNNAINSVGNQVGMTGLQTINAIQSGNASISSKICECCCENRLAIANQTNALQAQAAANHASDQLATCQQTNALQTQASQNTRDIVDAINDSSRANSNALAALQTNITKEFCDIREREMQSKIDTQGDIITQLRGQLDNDRQTAQLYNVIAPLQAKVNEIANKQPNTVPVEWPNLAAVNVSPYVTGGFYGGFGYGNGNYGFWS